MWQKLGAGGERPGGGGREAVPLSGARPLRRCPGGGDVACLDRASRAHDVTSVGSSPGMRRTVVQWVQRRTCGKGTDTPPPSSVWTRELGPVQGKGKEGGVGRSGWARKGEGGHKGVRGRWAPPPMEPKGSREGQRRVARGQRAPAAADSNTTRGHASPPSPPPPPKDPERPGAVLHFPHQMRWWVLEPTEREASPAPAPAWEGRPGAEAALRSRGTAVALSPPQQHRTLAFVFPNTQTKATGTPTSPLRPPSPPPHHITAHAPRVTTCAVAFAASSTACPTTCPPAQRNFPVATAASPTASPAATTTCGSGYVGPKAHPGNGHGGGGAARRERGTGDGRGQRHML